MRCSASALCAGALALCANGCGPKAVAPERLLGVWHEVASGESARSIAETYGADPAVVAELNDVPVDGALAGREEIFVPTAKGGKVPGTGATPIAPEPLPTGATTAAPKASAEAGLVEAACDPASGKCLEWPARGKLAATFGAHGGAQHDGIDIAGPAGTPVVAAEAGRVVYSGDGIKGYGNMILIKHEGGLVTVYAHNDVNDVRDGDAVARGQKIAAMGRSGTATAPHLHFEVRQGEVPVDPLLRLTRREDGE